LEEAEAPVPPPPRRSPNRLRLHTLAAAGSCRRSSLLDGQRCSKKLIAALCVICINKPDSNRRFNHRIVNHCIVSGVHIYTRFGAIHDNVLIHRVAGTCICPVCVNSDTVIDERVRDSVGADIPVASRDIVDSALCVAHVVRPGGNCARRVINQHARSRSWTRNCVHARAVRNVANSISCNSPRRPEPDLDSVLSDVRRWAEAGHHIRRSSQRRAQLVAYNSSLLEIVNSINPSCDILNAPRTVGLREDSYPCLTTLKPGTELEIAHCRISDCTRGVLKVDSDRVWQTARDLIL